MLAREVIPMGRLREDGGHRLSLLTTRTYVLTANFRQRVRNPVVRFAAQKTVR